MNKRQRRNGPASAGAAGAVGQRFEAGVKAHRAGRLDEARAVYGEILAASPDNPDALHLLGLVAHQSGDSAAAADLVARAIAAQPGVARFHNSHGLALAVLGRAAEAEASYGEALALDPRHVEALTNLGNLLAGKGRPGEAETAYRRALAVNSGYAPASNNLGNVLRERDALEEAADCYRKAIAARPDYVEAHRNLAAALIELGRLDDGEAACRTALELRPNDAEAHCALGIVVKDRGRIDEAEGSYRRALELKPDYAEAHHRLGFVLWKLGRFEDAETCCRRAIELQPEAAVAHNVLGLALYDQGRSDDAIAAYRAALAINPRDAAILNNLGNAYTDAGQLDAAETCYRQAIESKPDYATAYYGLANLGCLAADTSVLATLESLANDEGLPLGEAVNLHFALARIYADSGDFDRAFEHCQRGNILRKEDAATRSVRFDAAAHARYVDSLIETCTADFFVPRGGFGDPSERPVFIVGMPRSGTTLVEQILASHAEVSGQGECPDIGRIAAELEEQADTGAGTDGVAALLDGETARRLGRRYLEARHASSSRALRVTDKMPGNFLHLWLIALILPRARIIHCRRNALDVCVSCYIQNFGHDAGFTNDLTDLASYYTQYRRLMEHWRSVLPLSCLDVRYEHLVARQETVSREIIAFCGLDWDPRCLEFHTTERPVHTASNLQVRRRIFASSIDRWRAYERHLEPLIKALGDASANSW